MADLDRHHLEAVCAEADAVIEAIKYRPSTEPDQRWYLPDSDEELMNVADEAIRAAKHHIASTPDTGSDGAAEDLMAELRATHKCFVAGLNTQLDFNTAVARICDKSNDLPTPTPSPPIPDSTEGHKAGASGSGEAAKELRSDLARVVAGFHSNPKDAVYRELNKVLDKACDLAAALSDGGMGDE